uniref:Cyclic nucleotide gated channel subunit alpha 4 n=1 Tax=Pavo cristatus TaxID=9049 RepID=A0A8C9F9G9_PAVCR
GCGENGAGRWAWPGGGRGGAGCSGEGGSQSPGNGVGRCDAGREGAASQCDVSAPCAPSRSTAETRRWILDPAGERYYWWLSAMVLPVLYNWVVIICRCCFTEAQERHAALWLSLDCVSDAFYLLDIAVRLHTGLLEEGILVLDGDRIRRRYLHSSSFRWDVASVLPTELLCLRLRSALRANRCLRAPRLFEAFDRRETRTAHPHAFRIAKLMLYVFVAIHWNACLYFALSVSLGLGSDTWVHPNGSRPGFARPLRQYLHSFYISTLILTTVGDTPEPRREEEFLFMTAGFLLAVLGFATIMGSMSSVIANMSAADASFYPEHGPVRRYLRAHGVAGRLVRRVAAWHEHLRAQRKLAEERAVLRHLPERLRAEVAASVHLPALSKVGLFQSCERGVLEALVLRLRPQVFGPGEFVCRQGDVGREMYFIREGRLEVLGADGVTQLAVLGEGLYFGEISLINIPGNRSGNRRTADIRSIGYADLFCLAKEDLAEVLTEFPSARVLLEAKGREILLRMDKLDVHAEAAAAAAREEAEHRARVLEAALEALQTRTARLLAQLESSALKLALRIGRLESRLLPPGAPRPQHRPGAQRTAVPGGGSDCAGAANVPSGGGREPREPQGSPRSIAPSRAARTWGCQRRVMPAPDCSAPGGSVRGRVRARSGARDRQGSVPGSGSTAFPPPARCPRAGARPAWHRVLAPRPGTACAAGGPQELPGTAQGWHAEPLPGALRCL